MDGNAYVQLFLFLTVVANLLYQWFAEGRKQRRELEAEERAKDHAKMIANLLSIKTEQAAAALAVKASEAAKVIEGKIDANTQISVEAFKQANDVNTKIQTLAKEAAREAGKEVAKAMNKT